jgi:predicted nucleotidyltransferase
VNFPQPVEQGLNQFVESVRSAFGLDLVAIMLYGSAAEGRLRASSDVNTITVVKSFSRDAAHSISPALFLLANAIRLETMFILESEIVHALNAFPVKFADIRRRKRVLSGSDPFAHIEIPRAVPIGRLRQVLLNTVPRTRQSFSLRCRSEERMLELAAEMAGPFRSVVLLQRRRARRWNTLRNPLRNRNGSKLWRCYPMLAKNAHCPAESPPPKLSSRSWSLRGTCSNLPTSCSHASLRSARDAISPIVYAVRDRRHNCGRRPAQER